jgi:hypothetical protein
MAELCGTSIQTIYANIIMKCSLNGGTYIRAVPGSADTGLWTFSGRVNPRKDVDQ